MYFPPENLKKKSTSNAHLKSNGGTNMVDEPKEPKPKDEESKEEEPKETPKEGIDAIKSLQGDIAQLKSVNEEQNKVIAELKAILEKPQMKSLQQPKEVQTTRIGPLSLI